MQYWTTLSQVADARIKYSGLHGAEGAKVWSGERQRQENRGARGRQVGWGMERGVPSPANVGVWGVSWLVSSLSKVWSGAPAGNTT